MIKYGYTKRDTRKQQTITIGTSWHTAPAVGKWLTASNPQMSR